MFIENGYSSTSLRSVADKLDISPGHLVFYFPTKELLLAVLIDELCSFQWKLIKKEAEDGISTLLAVCLELMTMAAAAEEDEIAKDFLVSAYQSRRCLEMIQKNDIERAKEVFAEFCSVWTDEQFKEAESLISGIEYAKLNIALKEANETYYWLRLLHETDYLTDKEFKSIEKDIDEIIAILVSICKKTSLK